MNKLLRWGLGGLGLAAGMVLPSWAQVYRCVGANEMVVYADEPCAKGERGGEVNIQPLVLDSKEGRERNQKTLDELKPKTPSETVQPQPEMRESSPSVVPSRDRSARLDRCQPVLEQSSGVRRQAIGSLCGADLDEATFDSCLNRVQLADSTGEMEALVRACTGTGFGNGVVVERPVVVPGRRPPRPAHHCNVFPNDPACRKPSKPGPVPDRMGPPNKAQNWGGIDVRPPFSVDTDRGRPY